MKSIAIIGAGLSGLTLAKKLVPTAHVEVFEKHHRAGGRIASRTNNDVIFDHGAQFFTVKNDKFSEFLQPMVKSGVIQDWQARFVEIDSGEIINRRDWTAEFPHYVGTPCMAEIGAYLSKGLTIHYNTPVSRVVKDGNGWQIESADKADTKNFDWVIVTTPPEQARDILPDSSKLHERLAEIKMKPCFALMLTLNQQPRLDFDAALVKNANISWISANHTKPGRTGASLMIHASNKWAAEHLNDDLEDVKSAMVSSVRELTGIETSSIDHADIKRWVYANIGKQDGTPYLIDKPMRLAACGDWCIKGRVESAFVSASTLAEDLLSK